MCCERRHLEFLRDHPPCTTPNHKHELSKCKSWVHANGGIVNGGVACIGGFCAFCAFLCVFVRVCAFFPAKKEQICTKSCRNMQKILLCNTPFNYTPSRVSPKKNYICTTLQGYNYGAWQGLLLAFFHQDLLSVLSNCNDRPVAGCQIPKHSHAFLSQRGDTHTSQCPRPDSYNPWITWLDAPPSRALWLGSHGK